ncbi:MAG: TetR/AcrR family transcriptional regulator [Pseudomonadota bacterium]
MVALNYLNDLPGPETGTEGRRERKKRATAHRIFRSAIELMQKDGFDGVTIEQICEKADVARATFFKHFPNKAALMGFFTTVVCFRLENELNASDSDATARLHMVADHLERLTSELGAVARDMMSAFIADPGVDFHIDEPNMGISRIVVAIIRDGQAEGTFSEEWTPEDVAITLVASWVALGRQRISDPKHFKDKHYRKALDLLLSGIRAR